MALTLERETTEYIYLGVTGNVPSTGVEFAFLAAGVRPTEPDWEPGVLIDSDAHALWDDAVASGVTGDYYIAILIGSFGGNTVVLTQGDYQVWVRLTDTTERPVRIVSEVLTIQ
jgi:hypothetical protein